MDKFFCWHFFNGNFLLESEKDLQWFMWLQDGSTSCSRNIAKSLRAYNIEGELLTIEHSARMLYGKSLYMSNTFTTVPSQLKIMKLEESLLKGLTCLDGKLDERIKMTTKGALLWTKAINNAYKTINELNALMTLK